MVELTNDEYEELIECRVRLNDVYKIISARKKLAVIRNDTEQVSVPLDFLELLSGYEENEKENVNED